MIDISESQGISPSDIVAPPERAGIHPFNYYAASSAGGRTHNQDAYFCPDSLYLPTIDNKDRPLPDTVAKLSPQIKQQLEETVSLLDGYDLETVLQLPQRVKKATTDGKLKGLAIVADGMQKYGGLGSGIATILVTDKILRLVENMDSTSAENTSLSVNNLQAIIADVDRIMASLVNIESHSFYTTLALVVTDNQNHTYCASVGDSRIYKRNRFNEKVELLTRDESRYWQLIEGSLDILPSKFFTVRPPSYISNPLGCGRLKPEKIQAAEFDFGHRNDQLIICTDGVWTGIDTKKPHRFTWYDDQYMIDVKRGISPIIAYQQAHAAIFRYINLHDLSPEDSSGKSLLTQITNNQVGKLSEDNITAIVIEKNQN